MDAISNMPVVTFRTLFRDASDAFLARWSNIIRLQDRQQDMTQFESEKACLALPQKMVKWRLGNTHR